MNADNPTSFEEIDFERRFGGIGRLYGEAALARFRNAHVCVVGTGGVGSWAVEALARSAIGTLTLIDLDNVAESNINRQIQALSSTIGQAKVSALAIRRLSPAPATSRGATLSARIRSVVQPPRLSNPG